MTYRFIDPAGQEIQVQGDAELRDAVLHGRLGPDTLMFDREGGRWVSASKHPAYRRVISDDRGPARAARPAGDGDAAAPGDGASGGSKEREVGKAFRIAQLLALIGVAHLAFIMSSSRYWAETAGFVVGHMVLLAALVALFLGWSKRTRPYIPFAMLAFTAWMALADIGDPPRGSEQMLDEFEAAVDRIERTYGIRHAGEGAGTAEVPETPPEAPAGSVDDRAMWAAQRTLYEYERLSLDYEGRYGLEAEHLEGWLEPHYFANASRYPEVPRYLARNRAAVEDMEQNFDRLMLERTVAVLNEADLPPAAREDFENSFLHGFRGSASRREQMYTIQKRWIATAEEFHQLLVENESVIRVNPGLGIAEIHDPWAEDRILDLYAEFQEQVERIADLQDEIMRDMRARIADGRQILR